MENYLILGKQDWGEEWIQARKGNQDQMVNHYDGLGFPEEHRAVTQSLYKPYWMAINKNWPSRATQ